MGAERDPAGQAGSGLTGTGYGTGETTGGSMGDPRGSAEVHTGLHSGRGTSDELSALGFAEGTTSTGGVRERVTERARTVAHSVREGAGTLGTRAGEVASQARDRLGELSERTNRALEQRGLLGRLQENPLPALAIAFGLGFLIAGGGRNTPADTPTGRVRRELRSALMAGLTAGAAQATRGFLQSAGRPDGALSSLLGGRLGEDEGETTGSTSRARTARSGGRMSTGLGGEDRLPSHQDL
jgi:hypothetical protein